MFVIKEFAFVSNASLFLLTVYLGISQNMRSIHLITKTENIHKNRNYERKHCEKVSLIFSLGKPALVLNFSQNHWATKISWEMVKIDKMARWNTREYCHHLSKKQGGKAERSSIMVVTRPVSQSLLSYICHTTLEMQYPRKYSLALNVKWSATP